MTILRDISVKVVEPQTKKFLLRISQFNRARRPELATAMPVWDSHDLATQQVVTSQTAFDRVWDSIVRACEGRFQGQGETLQEIYFYEPSSSMRSLSPTSKFMMKVSCERDWEQLKNTFLFQDGTKFKDSSHFIGVPGFSSHGTRRTAPPIEKTQNSNSKLVLQVIIAVFDRKMSVVAHLKAALSIDWDVDITALRALILESFPYADVNTLSFGIRKSTTKISSLELSRLMDNTSLQTQLKEYSTQRQGDQAAFLMCPLSMAAISLDVSLKVRAVNEIGAAQPMAMKLIEDCIRESISNHSAQVESCREGSALIIIDKFCDENRIALSNRARFVSYFHI